MEGIHVLLSLPLPPSLPDVIWLSCFSFTVIVGSWMAEILHSSFKEHHVLLHDCQCSDLLDGVLMERMSPAQVFQVSSPLGVCAPASERASEPSFYNRARTALMQLLWWYYKSSWWRDGCYMSCSRAACWGEIPWVFLPSLGAADKQTDISCSYPWLSLTNHPGIALPHSKVDFNFSTLAYLGLSWSYYQSSVIQDYKLNFSKHKL